MNQQRTRPKSAPINNSGPKKRRNPESPGQAFEKNSGSRLKNANKLPTSPSQNISNRNPCNNGGKKKPPRKQQQKH